MSIRIRIRIKVKIRVRIRIKVKRGTRIHIYGILIRNPELVIWSCESGLEPVTYGIVQEYPRHRNDNWQVTVPYHKYQYKKINVTDPNIGLKHYR
jgi:hypothetical protein